MRAESSINNPRAPDFPVLLRLQGKLCAVVGGGEVALRKITGLLECGAKVRVISPQLTRALNRMAREGKVEHIRRPYRRGDLKGAFLALGATDDPKVNKRLHAEASEKAILVNIIDEPELCTITLPARMRRGPLTIAISTGGASPALAGRMRKLLEGSIGPEYGHLARLLGRLRQEVKRNFPTPAARRRAWNKVLDADLLSLLREGKTKEAEEKARQCLSSLSA